MNKVQAAKTIIKLAKYLATDSSSSRTAGAKYTLTDETKQYYGHTLYRVKYADGKLGGWIQSEKNLQGNAKVLDESIVMGDAVVKDNAIVKGKSTVWSRAIVSGHAIVENSDVHNNATVSKYAKVLKRSHIDHNATITDHARIDYSWVIDDAKVFGKAFIRSSWIAGKSQVSGIVQDSYIVGKSIIEGKVKNCELKNRLVKQNESLENQDDF